MKKKGPINFSREEKCTQHEAITEIFFIDPPPNSTRNIA
jgi:hypothetical protein